VSRSLHDGAIGEIEPRIGAQILDCGIGQSTLCRRKQPINLSPIGSVNLKLSYS
jgi:hypothetical protein